jgi:hypothetical protein
MLTNGKLLTGTVYSAAVGNLHFGFLHRIHVEKTILASRPGRCGTSTPMNHLHLEHLLNRMTNEIWIVMVCRCTLTTVHLASPSTVTVTPFGRQSSFWHGHFVFCNVYLGTVWSAKLLIGMCVYRSKLGNTIEGKWNDIRVRFSHHGKTIWLAKFILPRSFCGRQCSSWDCLVGNITYCMCVYRSKLGNTIEGKWNGIRVRFPC